MRIVMANDMDSAITSKGQATIPKAIREHLGLKPGDRVKFFVHPDGTVVLLPKLPVASLRGMIKPQPQAAMIGLDTNVLVRYLTQDDPIQSRRATDLIERQLTELNPGFVSIV